MDLGADLLKRLAKLGEVLRELDWADEDPGAASGAPQDLLHRLILCTLEVDLPCDGAVFKVDVALLEGPPVLLGDDLVARWLVDDNLGQVLEASKVKLLLLLVSHVGQIEQLAADHITQVSALNVFYSLCCADDWVCSQDSQWESEVLGYGRDQVDRVHGRCAEQADWLAPLGCPDELLKRNEVFHEVEGRLELLVHEGSHAGLELVVGAHKAERDHLHR